MIHELKIDKKIELQKHCFQWAKLKKLVFTIKIWNVTHFFIAHKKNIRWQRPNKTIIHICMLLQLLCPGFQEKNVCSIFVDMMGKIAVDVPFQFIFYFFFSPRRRFFMSATWQNITFPSGKCFYHLEFLRLEKGIW